MTDQFVFEIMEKFNASDVVDLDFTRDGTHLSLKKREACVAKETAAVEVNAPVVKAEAPASAPAPKASEKTETKKAEKPAESKASGDVLKSPIVGTFYRAPSPDSPAYAEKGKKIKKGEPVCIIEAMKMMNTLNADFDMEIVDVLVKNGDLVEYDQPLFSIIKL